jgi:hypothetical protein
MRAKYGRGDITQEQLAAEYGVSGPHVCGILAGKFWKHINEEAPPPPRKTRAEYVVRGASHPCAKLTAEVVEAVRRHFDDGFTNHTRLAQKFGLGRGTIRRILMRQTWLDDGDD